MIDDDEERWTRKLTPELAVFARSDDTDERLSVLIELNVPSSQVTFDRDAMRRGDPLRPSFIDDENPEDQQSTRDDAAKELERVVGEQPHWIGAAKAFVASVSATQLHDIAQLPYVQRVRLNRRLR